LENIHVRYLEEIRNLNLTLGAFRSEKESEVRKFEEETKRAKEGM
jgi:hypothetical protein